MKSGTICFLLIGGLSKWCKPDCTSTSPVILILVRSWKKYCDWKKNKAKYFFFVSLKLEMRSSVKEWMYKELYKVTCDNCSLPEKRIGANCPFGNWTNDCLVGSWFVIKDWGELIIWSIALISRIQVECEWEGKDEVWKQNEVKWLVDVEAVNTARLGLKIDWERLLTSASRFYICSWEKVNNGATVFCSKLDTVLTKEDCGVVLLIVGVWMDLLAWGPLHLGGHPISWKHLFTRCPK